VVVLLKKWLYILILLSGYSVTACAGVIVTFGGNLSNFNPGPFENTAEYSGSFMLDDSIAPTGPNNNFDGAVTNFTVSIFETTGTATFTGTGGLLQQFSNAANTNNFVSIHLGGSNGSVNGSTSFSYIDTQTGLSVDSLFTLTNISFDLRGSDLFNSPLIVASNLDTSDFSYRRFVMGFERPITGVPIGNWSSINTLRSVNFGDEQSSEIPEPSTLAIFALGMMGLASRKFKKQA